MKYVACLALATYPEANGPGVALPAVALARHVGADLHAAVVDVDIPDVSNALSSLLLDLPGKIREAEAASRAAGSSLLSALSAEAARLDVPFASRVVAAAPAMMGDVAAGQCRYFDLALVGLGADNPTARMTAEAVLFGAGRPTLVFPETTQAGGLDHVVIAWDASRVAARAVADARPFLERAQRVTVISVTDEKPLPGKDIAERLAECLRMRGLSAESASIRADGHPIGAAMQEHAVRIGGGLLVMGGYGHSRVRDFVLGGATEGVLGDPRLPVLLSH